MLNKNEVELHLRNGAKVVAIAVESVNLRTTSGGSIPLERCYFVPNIIKNIIFISCLAKIGFKLIIENNGFSLYYDGNMVSIGYISNSLYVLDTSPDVLTMYRPVKRKREKVNQAFLWHCQLGHISEKRISKLLNNGYLDPFYYESFTTCESCLASKMTKSPFTGHGERASELLELIHSDACRPMSTNAS